MVCGLYFVMTAASLVVPARLPRVHLTDPGGLDGRPAPTFGPDVPVIEAPPSDASTDDAVIGKGSGEGATRASTSMPGHTTSPVTVGSPGPTSSTSPAAVTGAGANGVATRSSKGDRGQTPVPPTSVPAVAVPSTSTTTPGATSTTTIATITPTTTPNPTSTTVAPGPGKGRGHGKPP